jgi:NADH:ubiquinone oxidoreductase subunit F (NADH-binding)
MCPKSLASTCSKAKRWSTCYYEEPQQKEKIPHADEIPFYRLQKRMALRNCGLINPEKIEEYIANGGYQAIGKALTQMTPEDVIDTMKASGLRGRGGARFHHRAEMGLCQKLCHPRKVHHL